MGQNINLQGGDESQIKVLLHLLHIQWKSLRNRARKLSNQAKSTKEKQAKDKPVGKDATPEHI
jgi:hypothetical protein